MEMTLVKSLHSKLEVPGQKCPGLESNPGLHGGRRAKRAVRTACQELFGTSTYEPATDNYYYYYYYLSFNDKKKNPTVDVVEVKLAAEHKEGPKGQAETERSRQVTVTYARVQ
jgi:hypothetical protein